MLSEALPHQLLLTLQQGEQEAMSNNIFEGFDRELPVDMMHLILSFLSPVEWHPLRCVNRAFYVFIERVMEQQVRNREIEVELLHGEEQVKKELFTSFDLESGLYADVFDSWSDLARNRYLYEQLVPSSCTNEDIELLKCSRGVGKSDRRAKVTLCGPCMTGKTMFTYTAIQDRDLLDHYPATIGAGYAAKRFAIGNSDDNRFNLEFWDTAGGYAYEELNVMYVRGCNVLVFMVPLNDNASSAWLQRLHHQYRSGRDRKCLVIGTKKDLKQDNRLSYDLITYCARSQLPYYECDLRDSEQMYRVLYAIMLLSIQVPEKQSFQQ